MSLQTLDLPWRFRDTCCCATFHARTTGERQQTLAWHVGESPLSATYTLGAPLEPAPARKPQANPHMCIMCTQTQTSSQSVFSKTGVPRTQQSVAKSQPGRPLHPLELQETAAGTSNASFIRTGEGAMKTRQPQHFEAIKPGCPVVSVVTSRETQRPDSARDYTVTTLCSHRELLIAGGHAVCEWLMMATTTTSHHADRHKEKLHFSCRSRYDF